MLSTIRMKKSEGFTLIELMIVIAIIGILAAVAIPQFSAYRIRGFNSSALSDARGGNTIESAFYADYSQFGTTIASTSTTTDPVTLANNAGLSQGSRLTGPQAADNVPYIGALMGTTHRFSSLPLGNLVSIKANTILNGANFLLQTKHEKGDTMYGLVDRSSAVYYLEDKKSAGDTMSSTLVVLGSTPSTLNPFANTTTWAVR